MNIFVLDSDPAIAAEMMCDKHIVKMPLESAQMLSTAINMRGGDALYKSTHINHPCSVWTRQTLGNFLWLYDHGIALCDEYTNRYNKEHKSRAVIVDCLKQANKLGPAFINLRRTQHPLCMPDEYKTDSVVDSYRDYYSCEKYMIASWSKTSPPSWWPQQTDILCPIPA